MKIFMSCDTVLANIFVINKGIAENIIQIVTSHKVNVMSGSN